MKRMYKIISSIALMVVVFSGCEKKQEEVNPTETTTTIIEVDEDGKIDADDSIQDGEENNDN
mgnify:CR=1 FL=1